MICEIPRLAEPTAVGHMPSNANTRWAVINGVWNINLALLVEQNSSVGKALWLLLLPRSDLVCGACSMRH